MKLLVLPFLLVFVVSAFAKDVTRTYNNYYNSPEILNQKDLRYLSQLDIILVPGILSEVFSWEDRRVVIDFSILTSDYFGAQVKHLKHKLKLPVKKILPSSKDVSETQALIAEAMQISKQKNRKALFIVHSLGGLALLDHLLASDESELEQIEGIIFMQSPFFGTPIATVFLDYPYQADKWLKPFLPFFNTSVETIEYLSVAHRAKFMRDNKERITAITNKIPSLTMSGITNNYKSLFTPVAEVIEFGCILNAIGRCFTIQLYKGPYDQSDGMVPLNSSRLSNVDSVVLKGVDHGGPIMKLPFQEVSKEIMTEALIKMMLERSGQSLN